MSKTARIRIGTQSAFSAKTVTLPFEYAAANGFGAFEWLPDKKESGEGWNVTDVGPKTRRHIRKAAVTHDVTLSVHAPWYLNPSESNFKKGFLETVDFARDIGASLLNVHLFTDHGIDAYLQGILPFLESLAKFGIRLSIENTPLTGPEDFNAFFAMLQLDSPDIGTQVGMCVDLGHANLCSATQNDYLKFVDLLDLSVPIIHVHMHENYGDYDSHLTLFTGPAAKNASGIKEFIKRMKERHFSGCIILEQWPEPPDLLNEARNRLLEIIGNSTQPGVSVRAEAACKDDFVRVIVQADRQHRSWREKLGWVHAFITQEAPYPDTDQLAYLMIYLRFISTGEVFCEEDGHHYRPSHHAKMAQQIQKRLSEMTTSENVFIIRRIYPLLPSCDSAFTNTETLTRIRDIAHRNDIPQELKQEIKRTLQNKLHRCASPEDLTRSAALLERISAPGANYSPDFVQEFTKFHGELKEFFSARSLDEQLEAIVRAENFHKDDPKRAKRAGKKKQKSYTLRLVNEFLEAKKRTDTLEELITTFELLTNLRSQFLEKLTGEAGSNRQELQLADIGLENFSFVLLSRLINHFEASEGEISWPQAMHGLTRTTENLRLSGVDGQECQAIESELALWRSGFEAGNREHLIRLKATIDRCRRLSEAYCHEILSLLPEKVRRLGKALGVAEDAVKVFCEADIRSHLIFQLSRLVDLLLKRIRTEAALPPWDAIVCGKASGRLVEAPRIDDLTGPFDKPIVALLEKVEGDEETLTGVAGMIVAHETPHLSHIAVRARQGQIVFAVCEDADQFSELRHLVGKTVVLDVSAEEVNLGISCSTGDGLVRDKKRENRHKHVEVPDVILSSSDLLICLDQVTPATGGTKADGARRLEAMSRIQSAGFRTPLGLVIPFGVMEASLHCASALEQEYLALVNQLNEQQEDDFLEVLKRLQDIICKLNVPQEIVSGVIEKFAASGRLMVRSSANCEDLEGLSAAGLFDSVANVSPSEVAQAVSEVWASLWTRRAAESRKKLDIRHHTVHMAILIQQMLVPEFSFIMHTVNPISHDRDEVLLELAVGLGETLASAEAPGVPYRMVCHKCTGAVRTLSFASYSQALWPDVAGNLVGKTVDYSEIELSRDKDYRNLLGRRLGAIGRFVEDSLGRPQDIEGLVLGDEIYLVQSRAQGVI